MLTAAALLPAALVLGLHAHGVESTTAEIPPTVVPNVPQLPFEKYALPNGLEVILHEDHRVPEVVVDVWYKVGSKDEVAGRTGFAHLFEHVMFQGTKHVAEDKHFEYLQKAGASNVNGSTSPDRTNYFEVVPSNQVELALWLESDRMGFLLDRPGFRETLDNQRDVVKNERRQRVENRPMGLMSRLILEALYPPQHPYHHEVIGSMEDLSVASVDDVKAFFRTYYAPGNATLTIAGDFERTQIKELVEKYFAPIPPAEAAPAQVTPPLPVLTAPRRIAMEAKVQQPFLSLAFPSPPSFASGDRELDLIANLLANGKASRLYRRLVYDMKIAQSVSASQDSQKLASYFEINASPMPGHTLDELLGVIDEELDRLRREPPSPAELDRAKNQLESDTIRNLEPLQARAERLQGYNYLLGDPGFLGEDLRLYRAVDGAALQRVAGQYLKKETRVIVTVDPNSEAPIMGRVKK
ncbi:MAG TPA: pitrilysin family protein [Polyangia bacterium]|jgi:predicted Zn-dependent peptidase|nr:pitrilysin family protein [Polyangia bacterium]